MAQLKATTFTGLKNVAKDSYRKKIGNNTTATDNGDHIEIQLHGHPIVRVYEDEVAFSLAGYGTVTTRERVNQFIDGGVHQVDYQQMYSTPHYSNGPKSVPISDTAWYSTKDFGG